jgi:hypothetical protein
MNWGYSTGVWTQGLALAKQAHYHLSKVSIFSCFKFSDRVSYFGSRPASDYDPPTSTFYLAGIADV